MRKELLVIFSLLISISLVFAQTPSGGGGGGGASEAKIFYIDDTFKVGWTDGIDNYEAEYKVWKIEETADGNRTTLTLVPTGTIGISNKKEGDEYNLGYGAKIIFNQIYVSGDDKWISISLENAEFKESTPTPSEPSGGGGSGGSSTCEKYYTCPDGTVVQYCFIHKFYNEDGELTGVGCGCKTPEYLCEVREEEPASEPEEEVREEELPPEEEVREAEEPASEEEVREEELPPGAIICDGCVLGDKCAPVGYRVEDKYCNLNSEFIEYFEAGESCDNNFECKSNLCIDSECISGGLFRRILNWFRRVFGGE